MKVLPILAGFESMVEAPGNIRQLRKLIVQLAITGRLKGNDNDDLSADAMRSRIEEERSRRLRAEKPRKRPISSFPIEELELPVGLYDSARFVRLEDVAQLAKGLTPIQNAKPGNFPLVTTGAERSSCDHYDFDGRAAIIPLVSSSGHGSATLKRLHYQDGKFALGNILCAAFPFWEDIVSARFIFEYLGAFKEELLVSKMTGTANVTLTLGRVGAVPIPIVPPAVQRRVDELMALCDRLEAAQEEREVRRDRLAAASYYYLNNAESTDTVGYAKSYIANFPRITARPDQVVLLREIILDLAVRGRLILQNEDDEPATVLLKRVKDQSERAVARKKAEAKDDEIELAFSRPRNWTAVHLGSLCSLVTSGSRGWGEFYSKTGPKFIRAQNIRFGKLHLNDLACVNLPQRTEGARTLVATGDLLIVITGAGVTNPALLEKDLGEAYVSQHVALVRPTDSALSHWLLLCLMAYSGGRADLLERAYGAGKPGLNLDNIRSLVVPIPPLAEQRRIVAKVGELMILCDRLETQLTSTQDVRRRFLDAILGSALNNHADAGSTRLIDTAVSAL